ncbi:MAG: polyprenyl diphosphate synthase [Candidatus Caldipriscus sp.]|nr:polyprenyl diphosphate synthase [Candidatus Caldipriscus sp.]
MKDNIPLHVGIIMDGNGRWARKRGLPRVMGHKVGVESVRSVIRVARKVGIRYLTLYTFSSENWQRPKEEVSYLMQLLKTLLIKEVDELKRQGVRIRAIGRLGNLGKEVLEALNYAIEKTKDNKDLNLYLALSYGGRQEIVDAVNTMLRLGIKEVDEEKFRNFLYDPELPDVDLLIRTAGEYRISNFLLWHTAYAELYITDVLWPDFREEEFLKAIEDYSKRVRKFGKVI